MASDVKFSRQQPLHSARLQRPAVLKWGRLTSWQMSEGTGGKMTERSGLGNFSDCLCPREWALDVQAERKVPQDTQSAGCFPRISNLFASSIKNEFLAYPIYSATVFLEMTVFLSLFPFAFSSLRCFWYAIVCWKFPYKLTKFFNYMFKGIWLQM